MKSDTRTLLGATSCWLVLVVTLHSILLLTLTRPASCHCSLKTFVLYSTTRPTLYELPGIIYVMLITTRMIS